MASNPGSIHRKIVKLLQEHPEGLTSGQIRANLNLAPHEQAQLDRRRRDLRKWYILGKKQVRGKWVYTLEGKRDTPVLERGINIRIRAAILGRANAKCQMCGRSIGNHDIVLVVDHKIPVDWGGSNDEDNLWALCEDCNAGKKAYFTSQDSNLMRDVMRHKSIHVRIGELLKHNIQKPVPSSLVELVAGQDDWKKRTRELRYLGWKINASRHRLVSGKVESYYTLLKFTEWPEDPTKWIREFERKRSATNARKADDSTAT